MVQGSGLRVQGSGFRVHSHTLSLSLPLSLSLSLSLYPTRNLLDVGDGRHHLLIGVESLLTVNPYIYSW